MNADYKYKLAVCDVADKRTLESYRAKRATWLSWINTDEHHAIWDVLAGMVWTDVSFRSLTQFAIDDENSALHNTLLTGRLSQGLRHAIFLLTKRENCHGSQAASESSPPVDRAAVRRAV
jgi:hypothetical protein